MAEYHAEPPVQGKRIFDDRPNLLLTTILPQNVDINDLCSEFTKKARCDGTKVVLEPEGVTDILETLTVKRA